MGRGHGSRAETIVAHLTARIPLVNGAELGLRFDSTNEAELALASARGRRVRRISRPYALAVLRFSANIIQTMNRRRPSAVLVCVPCSSSSRSSDR